MGEKTMFEAFKRELYDFYLQDDDVRARSFAEHCFPLMEARVSSDSSVIEQKLVQYDVITEEFEPILFPHAPYFYETGVLTSLSDGARKAKLYGFLQACGWVYNRNKHLFIEQDEALYQKRCAQMHEYLYLICGPYNDTSQHFNFNCRPFLEIGACGIYEKAKKELLHANNEEEEERKR